MSEEYLGSSIELRELILSTAKEQIPGLDQINPEEVEAVTDNALKMVNEFEKAARGNPHPKIWEDTDVVWDIPAAGIFSNELQKLPEWQDRYRHLNWSRKMERARVRTSSAIVRQVTSLRVQKKPEQLTQEDIISNGPTLIYSGTPNQQENLRIAMAELANKYKFPPREKVLIVKGVKNTDGTYRDVNNTVDDVQALVLPDGLIPRRIVVVSHAQHLVRILHILGKFHEALPPSTIIQPYPLLVPKEGREKYTEMEIRGTLAAIYGSHLATNQPYPYQV